jgi:hypothetical protein
MDALQGRARAALLAVNRRVIFWPLHLSIEIDATVADRRLRLGNLSRSTKLMPSRSSRRSMPRASSAIRSSLGSCGIYGRSPRLSLSKLTMY